MAPVLGYWNFRGLGHAIRLAFAYKEIEIQEKRYKNGPPPEYDDSDWMKEKFSLGLDFPNLPYYIDGDIKITQSLAILRYVARKEKFDGKTEGEKVRIDIAEQHLTDVRTGIGRLCYDPDFDSLKDDFIKGVPGQLKPISAFLGKNNWIAGESFSYADILLYDIMDQFRILSPGCTRGFPNLDDHLKRFEALPTISKYIKSGKYIKWPINADMALFGSKFQKSPV